MTPITRFAAAHLEGSAAAVDEALSDARLARAPELIVQALTAAAADVLMPLDSDLTHARRAREYLSEAAKIEESLPQRVKPILSTPKTGFAYRRLGGRARRSPAAIQRRGRALSEATERAGAMAEQMARERTQVRFLRSIFVPGDEICFLLFTGPSAEAVTEVVRRASIKRVPGAPWPLSDRPGTWRNSDNYAATTG